MKIEKRKALKIVVGIISLLAGIFLVFNAAGTGGLIGVLCLFNAQNLLKQ